MYRRCPHLDVSADLVSCCVSSPTLRQIKIGFIIPNVIMSRDEYIALCDEIKAFSARVRFVGVIGEKGELLAHTRRTDLDPLLDSASTHYHFSQIAIKRDMNSAFNQRLGKSKFVWEELEYVQIISFTIGNLVIWVSIDADTPRSEVLRIIDSCMPIAKRYQ